MENNLIKEYLKSRGVTCNSCWWREGDRCYYGEPEREEGGRSKTFALEVCSNHKSKRSILEAFLGDMLTISSEETAKKEGKINKEGEY